MTQIGTVMETQGETAVIEVKRASACGENCAHCKGGCTPAGHRATVSNAAGAQKGDMVKIEVSDSVLLRSAFLLYMMPIVVMLFAYGIAFRQTQNTTISIIACISGLIVSFLVLKILDAKIAPKPKIVSIIPQRERTE